MTKVGYHVGAMKRPAETLPEVRYRAKLQSRVGYLGTGFYFFGKKEDAEQYAYTKYQYTSLTSEIEQIDLTKYNLYRPTNPSEFVEALRITTINLFHLEGQDLKDEIKEAAEDLAQFCDKSKSQVVQILVQFTKDLKDANLAKANPTQLSNRLLDNYDGIDLTNTRFDNFGTGSIIFS